MTDFLNDNHHSSQKWKGYTLDELRYRRALTGVAIEIEKDRLSRSISSLVPGALKSRTSGASMLSKAFGALSYVDYAILGWKLFKKLKSFRHPK